MAREILDEKNVAALLYRLGYQNFKFSKVAEGVSTNVYKLEKDGDVSYLRILSKGESASLETATHTLLMEHGVHVPVVESFEDNCPELGASFMIVKDIGGDSLESQFDYGSEVDPRVDFGPVLFAAGQDMARINSIPVSGFGKIKRSEPGQTELKGKYRNSDDYIFKKLDKVMKELEVVKAIDIELIQQVKNKIEQHRDLLYCEKPVLAHGDLDLSHIYSDKDGYTGMIDFGDMRGASQYFDLAYFRFRTGTKFIPKLIEGYQSIRPLDKDYNARLQIEGLVIAVQKLVWALSKGEDSPRFLKAISMLQGYLDGMTI